MASAKRVGLCAFVLFVIIALNPQSHQARATDTSSGPPMTLAMVPAPVVAPPLAEPVLLCGDRWVNTKYVLGQNCMKACLTEGHSAAECKLKYVPLCQRCWGLLLACSRQGPPATRCSNCTERYAACMRPFF